MTTQDPSQGRPGGLLGWLGFGKDEEAAQTATSAASGTPRDPLRQRQLDEIASFLAYHKLEISAATLSVAHDYLTGSDPDLVRLIDRQMQARQPVTLEWLDEVHGRNQRTDEVAMLTQLMVRLEGSIDEFGKTSKDASSATSEYSNALEAHVTELEQVTKAGEVISELASIAKVMLKRTRDIEAQMQRSEAQTKSLKKRLDEAKRSAEEDHLTGLPNRRAFEARFAEEFRGARAAAEPLCVAFCDIDHFKMVNDTHGHDAGDRVLKLVADSLARISGETCHVARHGGEEFVLLFRGLTVSEGFAKLDALRAQLAERRLVNRATDQPFGQITFSGGIADVFVCGDPRAALKAADAALYRAKQGGRNRVLIADESDMAPSQIAA
jgi:diguanylate cyclase